MRELNSNTCDDSRPSHVIRLALIAFLAVSFSGEAMAQRQQQQNGASPQGAGNAAGLGQDAGLTPDQAFSGGIERTGVVGQSAAPAVGANASSAAGQAGGAATGRPGGGLGGGFGGGGLGAAFGNLFNNNNTQSSDSTPAIRTRLRSAVSLPPNLVPSIQSRQYAAQSRFQAAPSLQPQPLSSSPANRYGDVNVQIRERTAVLQGTVSNERDRRMSELLMRLEPGVNRIQNRISVAP